MPDEGGEATAARQGTSRPGSWLLLAVLVVVAAVLTAVVVHADIDRIADPGWRDNALWATGTGVVLLGIALAVLAWVMSGTHDGPGLARTAVVVAVMGVTVAVLVVVVADERGGERVAAQVPIPVDDRGEPIDEEATTADDGERPPEPILTFRDSRDPEHIVDAALPIESRLTVTINLTPRGRQMMARSMQCRPQDFIGRSLIGQAIGGTWAQPLIIVSPPFDDQGNDVLRCRRVIVRLPMGAGTIRPGF